MVFVTSLLLKRLIVQKDKKGQRNVQKNNIVKIIVGLGILVTFAGIFYFQKPVVRAGVSSEEPLTVLPDKTWVLHFSKPIDEKTINEDNISVKNHNGELVDVTYHLSSDGRELHIKAPERGYPLNSEGFSLHVSKKVKSVSGMSIRGETNIAFSVVPTLPTIKTDKELKNYFLTALKHQKEESKWFAFNEPQEESTTSADSSITGTAKSNNFSKTNNQVQGVDEGDTTKTDGSHIYQIIEGKVVIVNANPTEQMKMEATISFQQTFHPQQLFLHNQSLIVIGSSWKGVSWGSNKKKQLLPIDDTTKVIVYDITNKTAPKITREMEIEGQFVTSRKIDSTMYFIANHSPNYWRLEKDKTVDLRPRMYDSSVADEYNPIPFEAIKKIPQSNETNFTLIGSFDLANSDSKLKVDSYLGSGEQIYMSQNLLYIAVNRFHFNNEGEWTPPDTEIYKFKIDRTEISFQQLGEVEGQILNQFSMDEHNGYFRIATTKGDSWNEEQPSTNNIYILDEKMNIAGEIEDLAKGERIYSVRFMGDRAYIVTFKQVDPLFVIDASDPTNPTVLGELKVPGFSSYLHPYDENHLIGFGYDTKLVYDDKAPNSEPIVLTQGMKISLFDITDFHHPKEKDTEIIGGRGTQSELLYNHKVLFHHPGKNLYGFPITMYREKEESTFEQEFLFQGALLYEITPENGIVEKARLTDMAEDVEDIYEDWNKRILRLLYIEDSLYTISNNRLTAYQLENFNKQASVLYDASEKSNHEIGKE